MVETANNQESIVDSVKMIDAENISESDYGAIQMAVLDEYSRGVMPAEMPYHSEGVKYTLKRLNFPQENIQEIEAMDTFWLSEQEGDSMENQLEDYERDALLLVNALEELLRTDDEKLPKIINCSFQVTLPRLDAIGGDAEFNAELKFPQTHLSRLLRSVLKGFSPREKRVEQYKADYSKRIEEIFTKLYQAVNELRKRGVVFVFASDNGYVYRDFATQQNPIWQSLGITVSGFRPKPDDQSGDFQYSTLAINPDQRDVGAPAFVTIAGTHYREEGNSYATPVISAAVALVLNSVPELMASTARNRVGELSPVEQDILLTTIAQIREDLIKRIINRASTNEVITDHGPMRYINFKVLKEQLVTQRKEYITQFTDALQKVSERFTQAEVPTLA